MMTGNEDVSLATQTCHASRFVIHGPVLAKTESALQFLKSTANP
jgi:hypothetical protein